LANGLVPFVVALLVTACSAQSETGNPPKAGSGGAETGGAGAGTGGATSVDPGSGGITAPIDAAGSGGGGGSGMIDAGDAPAADSGPLTNCMTAGSELCEDFESGQLDMQRWKLNKPSASASITVDDIHAHTGKYAVHIKVVPNQQSTAMINETVTFPSTTNAFYARMFVYFSPDIPVAGGANPDMHTGFLLGNGNNDRGNVQAGVGLSGFGSAKQWLSYSIFYASPKFEFGPSSKSLIAANQWQCVELFEDGSDPKTEIRQIWVDDKELTELKTDSAKAAGGQSNHLPPKWASVSFGIWEYHPIPVLSDMWIDDIRVSSKKIGCAN
jgi:hypothetical protein